MVLDDILKNNYLYYTNNGSHDVTINFHPTFKNCQLEDVIPFKFKSYIKSLSYRYDNFFIRVEGRYTGSGFEIDTVSNYQEETFSEFLMRVGVL